MTRPNSNKIEITFPNGEKIECDNLIALLQMDDLVEEFEQILVGNWELNELIETKFFLQQMYNEKIKERLSPKDKLVFENIQQKKKRSKQNLKQKLSQEERDLYNFLEPEAEILMSEDLPEDIDEQDLEKFFDEIFNTLDELGEDDKTEQDKIGGSEEKKIIDLEQYRNK
ncbi:hypothetical protein [Halanaerobacter jeridensis]|uniref:Uncharacterized protein n=1 Tax=Halanaerobacter jeridensis TaxID=706427 RepID=A0A938XQF6_9FIRM|nr:hypothetical protein [Halanaerobacter jeridensis]MBM7555408.1 hypothetical protein [Halanaerobacter jeridensis]